MDLIYLAVPYTHPDPVVRQRRFEAATAYAAKLMLVGHTVFSPITHSHPIAQHGQCPNWSQWQPLDLFILSLSRRLVVLCLDGWEQSEGVRDEIQWARNCGVAMEYHVPISIVPVSNEEVAHATVP